MGLPSCLGNRVVLDKWRFGVENAGWNVRKIEVDSNNLQSPSTNSDGEPEWEKAWDISSENESVSLSVSPWHERIKGFDEGYLFVIVLRNGSSWELCHAVQRIFITAGAITSNRAMCNDIWRMENTNYIHDFLKELSLITTVLYSKINALQPNLNGDIEPLYSKVVEFSLCDIAFKCYFGPAVDPKSTSLGEYIALSYRTALFGGRKRKQAEALSKIDTLLRKYRGNRIDFYNGLFGQMKKTESCGGKN